MRFQSIAAIAAVALFAGCAGAQNATPPAASSSSSLSSERPSILTKAASVSPTSFLSGENVVSVVAAPNNDGVYALYFPSLGAPSFSVAHVQANGTVTSWAISTATGSSYDYLNQMAFGPDGALWIVGTHDQQSPSFYQAAIIDRYVPGGTLQRMQTFPGGPNDTNSTIGGRIVSGPAGRLWFDVRDYPTNHGAWYVSCIEVSGTLCDYRSVVTTISQASAPPLVATPDSATWGVNLNDKPNTLVRVSSTGSRSIVTVPAEYQPYEAAASNGAIVGPDGALWFAAYGAVGRMTLGRYFSFYPDGDSATPVGSLTAGSDGNIWFTHGNTFARMTPKGAITLTGSINDIMYSAASTPGYVWFGGQDALYRVPVNS